MPKVILDGAAIASESEFHAQSAQAFGFPDSYSGTIDGWVDNLSYLRDDENMTRFRLGPKEVLTIVIAHAADLRARLPDLLEEIAFCVGGINERYEDYGEPPALKLELVDA
jgi:hypothetical protein